jgi:hypothetical protein
VPTRNNLLYLAVASLLWAGCRMTVDPSCSVQRELCDDRCLRCLYCPQCTTDCFSEEAWYCAPTLWTPRCGRTRSGFERVRPLPSADDVFALPRAHESE